MKHGNMRVAIAVPILFAFAIVGWPQETIAEPEFADVFFRLDAGKLTPLERQTAVIQGKASGFIVMSMKTASEFPGARSPVRFASGKPIDFVVRTPLSSSAVDPSTLFTLRRLGVKKKSRELVIMSGHASPLGASTSSPLAQGVLPVEFAKYGAFSLRMTTAALPPGEYAVSRQFGQTVFCFGVD
jgi:hypothetical protein